MVKKKKELGAHALAGETKPNAKTKGEEPRRKKKNDNSEDKSQSAIRFDPDEADAFLTEWRQTRGHDSMDSPRQSRRISVEWRRSRDRVSIESPRGGWASRAREGITLGNTLDLEAPFSQQDEYVKNLIKENEYAEPEAKEKENENEDDAAPSNLQRSSVRFQASEQHHRRNRGHDSMENRRSVALAESRRSRDRPSVEGERGHWTKTSSPPGPRKPSFDSDIAGFFLEDGCVPEWVNKQEELVSKQAAESNTDIPDIPLWDTPFWHRAPKASSQPVAEEQSADPIDADPVISSAEALQAAPEAPMLIPTAEELAMIQHLLLQQNQWQPLPLASQNVLNLLGDMVQTPHSQLGQQGVSPVPVSGGPSSGDGGLRVFT